MSKYRINLEDIQPRKLMIATPMYGAVCHDAYVCARDGLKTVMGAYGLTVDNLSVRNDSSVARARNTLADEFLKSDFTHMLFWDADIVAIPDDALALLNLADPKSNKDIVCGLYPKKHIRWDKVEAAVRQGVPTDQLDECIGDMVFNPIGLRGEHDLFTPLEVLECGTGFMMIQRHALERFAAAWPHRRYRSMNDGKPGHTHCFFIDEIASERYLTEDYNFCRLAHAAGLKIWVAPWLNLGHIGNYEFRGNPAAVSSLIKQVPDAA